MKPYLLLGTFLLFHPAGASFTTVPASNTVLVGGSVKLPLVIPKGMNVTNLLLRASSREEGVGVWLSGKHLSILSRHYVGRVTFLEKDMAFSITNLSLQDGGNYEVSTRIKSSEEILGNFTVAVFNITKRKVYLGNGSCGIDLHCEAGMGSTRNMTYSWMDRSTGTILTQDARLHQVVHAEEERSYTCRAKIPAAQSAMDFVLKHACLLHSAGAGRWVLGLAPLLARGLLAVAAVLLL